MKRFYEFKLDETATTEEEVAKITEELGISLEVNDGEKEDFKALGEYLSKEKSMKLIVADCALLDEDDFRVFIFSEDIGAKKKVKDRYIRIMTEKYDFASRLYTRRLEEMLNHIYD